MYRSLIRGVGGYLPEKVVTNHDLAETLETSHDWIVERTGIHQRHFARDDEFTSHMCVKAAQKALKSAGITAEDLGLIVIGTTTPDLTFPSTATIVQRELGNTTALCFDAVAACAGFLVALNIADNALKTGQAKYALVIGAESITKLLDMNDRSTAVLFGDGAGAVILEAVPEAEAGNRGIMGIDMQSDGRYGDILNTSGGPSSTRTLGKLQMDGQEVYKHAVTKLLDSAKKILTKHALTGDDIDWMIPHQANIRIVESVAGRLGMPMSKVVTTMDKHANTSAASIPLALWVAVNDGRVKEGDLILHEAIGGGLVWGSALVRF